VGEPDHEPGRKVSDEPLARTKRPEDTLRAMSGRAKEFGVTRLADVTGLDKVGIPVALAIRPAARSVSVSQGKGVDLVCAKVSALMEAIELWHAETIDARLLLASIEEVAGTERAADVDRLPQVAGPAWCRQDRLLWIEGRDLATGRPLLVPYEMVHADYSVGTYPGHGAFPASTNGLASGNHMDEALCSALCELIERDAVSIWHHRPLSRRSRTRLSLGSINDRQARALIGMVMAGGLDVAVWDVTTDLGVPAFQCLIHPGRVDDDHIGLGSCARPDKAAALVGALTEAAQTRLTYISGSRDDLDPEEYRPAGRAAKRRLAEGLLRAGPEAVDYGACPSFRFPTFRRELEWLLERLAACGMSQAIAVDLSKEAVGIAVVRAIVPGLEAPHDDVQYVAGPRARAAEAAP
jgi:YcaO-like protein with predicted kinase domain